MRWWSQLTFVLRRASSNLWELFWTHALTAGTMAMTLFIFGAFMLLEVNLQRLLKGWGDQIQINAYLDGGLKEDEVESLSRRVQGLREVARVRLITREQAWQEFRAALGTQSNVLEGLPRDVLPASFEIALKPGFHAPPMVERFAERLRQERGITLVEYPRDWIDRLSLLVLGVEWAKWILGVALFIITFFIVGSTVRLAILARRDEIEIMQLVGSSLWMIRAPFVLEGMVEGLVGGVLAVLALGIAFILAERQLAVGGALWGAPGQWAFLNLEGMALILLLGWSLGAAGSFFSLRRFIKTWRT